MRILIADSDDLQLQAYKDNVLKLFASIHRADPDNPISIQYCHTGGEIMSLMDNNSCRFDMTIIDRALSGTPGDVLIELYRPRLGKIIICSVFNNINNFYYLQKPVDFDKLSELIKEVLNVTDKCTDSEVQEYEVIG